MMHRLMKSLAGKKRVTFSLCKPAFFNALYANAVFG